MIDILIDLLRWCADRAWRGLRALSGDDAYERYLASREHGDIAPLTRGAFHEEHLARKWDRFIGCGRG